MLKEGETASQEEDCPTSEPSVPTSSQSSWRKKKRLDYNLRLKERRVAEWESLTDEQRDTRKQERKMKLETSEKVSLRQLSLREAVSG
jgi:hypothetical protein